MNVDDEVFYWTRKPGGRPELVRGRITAIDHSVGYARVHIDGGGPIVVKSVEVKRLKPIAELKPMKAGR